MFNKADSTASGTLVIFIVLLGCLFLCQTVGKLVMWLIARYRHTTISGQEVIEELSKQNHLDPIKVKTKKLNWWSSFYSYKKTDNEFIISDAVAKQENLASSIYAIQSVSYAKERTIRSLTSRWQLIGVGLLSIVPYLFFIGAMLLVYLPGVDVASGHIASKYSIPAEALSIIGWIFILVTVFWWMSATQDLQINMEDMAKQLGDNYITNNLKVWMKYASYIPFSFRTII